MDVTGRPAKAVGTGMVAGLASTAKSAKYIAICDTQPVTAEGIRNLLIVVPDLKFLTAPETLLQATDVVRELHPDVLILDKGFGLQATLGWLSDIQSAAGRPSKTGVVIWGASVTKPDALRFLRAGARGILRKSAKVQAVVNCLRAVAAGRDWLEDCGFNEYGSDRNPISELTAREGQILDLIERGRKNKEIATDLGIRPGTVKIHLKHIFEKTGVRGRYALALDALRNRFSPTDD